MIYDINTEFYVTYAIHERDGEYGSFVLKSISAGRFGLYETLKEKNDRTDGEIAEALDGLVNDCFGDGYHRRIATMINFWVI